MFYRLRCGCEVLQIEDRTIMLKACDRSESDDELSFHFSTRGDLQGAEPLPEAESIKLCGEIGQLVSDGYRFRTIKRLIGG